MKENTACLSSSSSSSPPPEADTASCRLTMNSIVSWEEEEEEGREKLARYTADPRMRRVKPLALCRLCDSLG